MNAQNDDTLTKVKKLTVNEVKAEQKHTQDAQVAKIMASSAVGLALGICTAYAPRHLQGTEDAPDFMTAEAEAGTADEADTTLFDE